jgi:predicted transcriptional regulator
MMKVKDVMTKKVISLKPDDNAKDALNLLFNMKISGLPVIGEKGELCGMFTEKEIIAKILPSYMESVGKYAYQENPKAVKQKILEMAHLKVEDVMRKDVITVDEDAPLCEVAHMMYIQKARRLIVLNKAKEVAGIIARGDVVKFLFEEYIHRVE